MIKRCFLYQHTCCNDGIFFLALPCMYFTPFFACVFYFVELCVLFSPILPKSVKDANDAWKKLYTNTKYNSWKIDSKNDDVKTTLLSLWYALSTRTHGHRKHVRCSCRTIRRRDNDFSPKAFSQFFCLFANCQSPGSSLFIICFCKKWFFFLGNDEKRLVRCVYVCYALIFAILFFS